MPILYNFHILLATFYMIYWTNLLIQCPLRVPVFLHVFCITENPYQKKPKCNKILRRIILEYMWFLGLGINANGVPHSPQGTTARRGRAQVSCGGHGAPFALIPPPKNHIYSKIILRKIWLHLEFLWYGFSSIQKTCKKTGTGTGHWINRLVQ